MSQFRKDLLFRFNQSLGWTIRAAADLRPLKKYGLLPSLRKQPTFGDASTGHFPAKWRLRNEHRKSILITCPYPDLGRASDWLNQISHAARPIRSTTQICAVTRRQYGISALVSQTSFGGETVGRVAKCLLFSQTYFYFLLSMYSHLKDILFREAQTRNFKTFQLRSCIDYVYKLVKDLITRHRKCNL